MGLVPSAPFLFFFSVCAGTRFGFYFVGFLCLFLGFFVSLFEPPKLFFAWCRILCYI